MTDEEVELIALKAGCKRPRVFKGPDGDHRVEFVCASGPHTLIIEPGHSPQQVAQAFATIVNLKG
jgi:hypothetical protein